MTDETPDIQRVSTRLVYENRWMRVREDAIRLRDGSTSIYGVVEKPDFVVVVPVHDDGSVTLVEQYRYPIGARGWEFCQGTWGPPGTDPALVAAHELAEETGLTAAALTCAGFLHNAKGTIAQGYHVFLATGLTQGVARPELEEQDLVSRRFGRADFERMIREGAMTDGVTLAAWGLLLVKGLA